MDALSGKNSTGRRVSLLNDGPEPPHQLVRLPSIPPSYRSRTSSYTSSPIGSPPTPRLVRSDSSDSANMHTPSPITPDFVFEGLPVQGMDSPVFAQSGFFPQQKDLNSAYPPVPQTTGPLPYHTATASQAGYFRPQQMQEQHDSAATAAANNARPKKNSYPCPMAKQYNCNDYFTTSGHAARHAKKHTGKKDAYCPECNKAFTRKDNMEQHRRTHQSGRNAAKGGDREVKKAKQQTKRPKPAPLQSSLPSLSGLSMVDPALPVSPAGSFLAPAVQNSDAFLDFAQRSPYPDPTAYSMTHSYTTGSTYGGLDALAIAASGEKRKFES
ncbi:Nn.00g016280.m01.CDS01 [Neocucurbitaria sp. VM-36]